MANSTPITKIYKLDTIGYDSTHKQFEQLATDLRKLREAKIALNKVVDKGIDVKDVEDAQRKVVAITDKQAETTAKSTRAYKELLDQYKKAKIDVEDLATVFGTESEQAKNAAAVLLDYKNQLAAIQALIKGTPKSASPASSSNLAAVYSEEEAAARAAGVAVSELERKEAEAANAATAWVNSQVLGKDAMDETANALERVKTPLEEYTGTLDENIRQNLQYKARLQEISATMKQLQTAHQKGGVDAEYYKNKMALLAKEEKELKIASAELTQTINAQVKFIQAADTSYDQLNATLGISRNLLRQLSEEEKSSPFGQQLAKDIAEMDTKLKAMDAQMGNFQRNVGNYKSAYNGLSNSINQIARELPSLNNGLNVFFSAIGNNVPMAVDEIKKVALQNKLAAEEVKKNAAAAALLAKEQALAAGASEDAANKAAKLAEKQELTNLQAIKGQSVFRQLLSSIFSWQTALVVLLTLLPAISNAAQLFFKSITGGNKALDDAAKALQELKLKQEALNKAWESQEVVTAITNVQDLTSEIELAKQGFISKEGVVKKYNETIGKTTGLVKDILQAEKELEKNAENYIQFTILKAAAEIASQDAAKARIEVEKTKLKKLEEFGNQFLDASVTQIRSQEQYELEQKKISNNRIARQQAEIKINQDAADQNLKIAANFREEAARLAAKLNFNFFDPDKDKKTKSGADKLSADEQNRLKEIEAVRQQQLSLENTRVNEIEKVRQLSFVEEREHLLRVQEINETALRGKIALFSSKRSLNAAEKAEMAKFGEDLTSIALETSRKLQDIEKRRFEKQDQALKQRLADEIDAAKEANQKIQEDPNASFEAKAAAKLAFDQAQLTAESNYLKDLLKLNQNYNQEAVRNARKRVDDIKRQTVRDQKDVLISRVKDLDAQAIEEQKAINVRYNVLRKRILDNEKLTADERRVQLEKLEQAYRRALLAEELKTAQDKLKLQKQLLDDGLISEAEYTKQAELVSKLAADLSASLDKNVAPINKKILSLQELAQKGIRKILSVKEGSNEDLAIGQFIAESYNVAQQAMSNYYEAERSRIQQSLEMRQREIDFVRDARIAQAQSQAEADSLARQAEAEKRAAQKRAGEEIKKTRRAELKIALATELANIAASAAQYPFPASVIIGASLGALALIKYNSNLATINAQQFATGGRVRRMGPGRITDRPNIPVQPNGDSILATLKPNEVVLNEPQQAALGGDRTFAAIGVPGFATGGSVSYPGSVLQPPVFVPALSNVVVSNGGSLEVVQAIEQLRMETAEHRAAIDSRIDRLQVVNDPGAALSAQNKLVKQQSIGDL